MPASEKQINANQQNAQKSTGPKTSDGKKRSSRNALKLGIHSKYITINSPHLTESQSSYNNLVKSLFDDLKPTNTFQEQLVRKIATNLWRSRRIVIAETAQINDQLLSVDSDVDTHNRIFGRSYTQRPGYLQNMINSRVVPQKTNNDTLLIYEIRLDNQLARTYQLLKQLQTSSEKDVSIIHNEEKSKPNPTEHPSDSGPNHCEPISGVAICQVEQNEQISISPSNHNEEDCNHESQTVSRQDVPGPDNVNSEKTNPISQSPDSLHPDESEQHSNDSPHIPT